MAVKHLPWANMSDTVENVLDARGCRVARCDWDGQRDYDSEQNAKFIVRAVNTHDDLLAALQSAVKWTLENAPRDDGRPLVPRWYDDAVAAISKAKGESP